MLNLLAGGLVGFFASLAAWSLGASGLAPRIEACTQIARSTNPDGTRVYLIKYRLNRRRWRPKERAVDGEIGVFLSVRGVQDGAPHNVLKFEIPTRRRRLLSISQGSISRFRIDRMLADEIDLLPPSVQRAILANTISLEDLLALGNEAWIEVHISASDPIMRARRTTVLTYKARTDDGEPTIVDGRFAPNSLEVLPREHELASVDALTSRLP